MLITIGFSAQSQEKASVTLITNARIFDGVNEKLIDGDILIENNLIKQVGGSIKAPKGAIVINAEGKTVIPGLIDVHWHMALAELPMTFILSGDAYEVGIRSTLASPKTLMRGFTTVRDMGGNVFSLKRLIDEGLVVGPRILPSGPMISQTGGHFDYRLINQIPDKIGNMSYWEQVGMTAIADGAPEARKRTREAFMMGATQIKIAGGGGVASH